MINIVYNSNNTIYFTGKETATANLTYYLFRLVHTNTSKEYLIDFDIADDLSNNTDRINKFAYTFGTTYEKGNYNYFVYEGTEPIGSGSGNGLGTLTYTGKKLLETGKAIILDSDIVDEKSNSITITEKTYEGQGT